MLFLKPVWVRHEDNKPIFSVDIHPKGGRFVTGGQGGEGGRIVIWNIAPVLSEDDEVDPKVPKMLCQMDNHLACVNVVRWSCQGHLLASGGDDKLVMIWKLTGEGSSTIFGSSGKVNVETWKCIHTLNSHNGDVLDVSWAPHDGWLASGSVDNTVIIWNAHKFPEKIAILKGHTGMVKGVAWDPVGKYLASQSDDKSLRVWRTADWMQTEVVTDPFAECSATTHVLRLSWSPDGQYLVSAHAMNGGGPTAQIIERDGWKQDKDFVGHRKAVTCVRFNSNILKKFNPGSPKTQQYCCCAIGSRDRSISVWLTSLKRPLVVIKDLFEDSVLDISWSSNGLHLLACSWDGTIACVVFSPEEIGSPLSVSEKNSLYERMYGKSLQRNLNQSYTGSQIIENPELLNVIEENILVMEAPMKEIPKVMAPPEVVDSPKPSNILVPANKQIETRLPDGKRRITPMFLKPVPTTPTKDTIEAPAIAETSTFSTSSPTKSKIVVVQESAAAKSAIPLAPSYISSSTQPQAQAQSHAPGIKINQLMCTEVPGDEPIVQFINVLDPLKMPPGTVATKMDKLLKLQVTNSCFSTSKGSLARIEVFKSVDDKQSMWETYLGSPIKCIQNNRKYIVACCEDLSINCYYVKSGARLLPPLLVEDVVSVLCLSDNGTCLILTKTGLLHMWKLEIAKSILSRVSIRSLLSNKVNVSTCTLTDSDLPLITLSDGRAYLYSLDLNTWILLSNPLDPLSRISGNMTRNVSTNLPLSSLQKCMPLHGASDNLPSGVGLSFLESQITASCTLNSPTEFRHWLIVTVNHILDKGPECRLRSILDELMGPTHSSVKKHSSDLMGISKQALLKDILAIVKTRLPWQRLYKEYSEQLILI